MSEKNDLKVLEEKMLKNKIKQIVRESLESMGKFNAFEDKDDNIDGREADINNESPSEKRRRSEVENFFKKKGQSKSKSGINNAYFAYKLSGVEPKKGKDTNAMKNARSQFEKKLNHEKNDAGYEASFSSEEINNLQSYISSTKLSEAVSNAIKKVLRDVNQE